MKFIALRLNIMRRTLYNHGKEFNFEKFFVWRIFTFNDLR